MPVLSQPKWTVLSPQKSSTAKIVPQPGVLRPLLHSSRKEVIEYANHYGLSWIEDESNADVGYPRNFLRHSLFPLLEQKFPAYRDTLSRSATHFAEASELLDDLARLDAPEVFSSSRVGQQTSDDLFLPVSCLKSLSHPRAKNLLRYFLHVGGAPMPQAVQLDDMLNQLCNARLDAAVCVRYGVCWKVHRYQGNVYLQQAFGEFERPMVLSWQGESELDWPPLNRFVTFNRVRGTGISIEKLQRAPVTLRVRTGGEALRPHTRAANRSLRNLMQERHVFPWLRDRLPLVYCGEKLVCVTGVAIDAEFQAQGEEEGVLVSFNDKTA
jgi:tRNA(Ile)-lysidine synthase